MQTALYKVISMVMALWWTCSETRSSSCYRKSIWNLGIVLL